MIICPFCIEDGNISIFEITSENTLHTCPVCYAYTTGVDAEKEMERAKKIIKNQQSYIEKLEKALKE